MLFKFAVCSYSTSKHAESLTTVSNAWELPIGKDYILLNNGYTKSLLARRLLPENKGCKNLCKGTAHLIIVAKLQIMSLGRFLLPSVEIGGFLVYYAPCAVKS